MNFLELKIPPLLLTLIFAILMWLTPALTGVLTDEPAIRIGLAIALLVMGQSVAISGVIAFRRAKTTVNPQKAISASALVSGGVYRYTRNPMYLGMLLVLLGWAAYLSNPVAAVLPLGFVLYMNRFQIGPEERVLLSLFGADYAAYTKQTRRWL